MFCIFVFLRFEVRSLVVRWQRSRLSRRMLHILVGRFKEKVIRAVVVVVGCGILDHRTKGFWINNLFFDFRLI